MAVSGCVHSCIIHGGSWSVSSPGLACREQGEKFKINFHTVHMSINYPSGVKHMWSLISELTSTFSCSGIRKSTLCMTWGHLFPISCRGNSQHFKGVRVLPTGKWDSESGSQKWSYLPHFYSDFSDRALTKSFDNVQRCCVLAQLCGCIASANKGSSFQLKDIQVQEG